MSSSTKTIGWRFPLNDGGLEAGFNDSGIETYRGNIYENLARETIQNSLDAAASDKPVKVAFELFELPSLAFPGRDELMVALESCRERYSNIQKARRFFDTAIALLRQEAVSFLRISDYNTTGLTGAKNDNPQQSNWYSLVKASGVSAKPEGAGGSFGIGKHAPYACSDLRCVFYGTLDRDGVTAFQGVARLATHKERTGRLTQGTGFYGVIEGCGPILEPSRVDPVFLRSEIGTDIFIAGFRTVDDWVDQIVRSVLENFFVAIHERRLILNVQGLIIDAESLPDFLGRYLEPDNLTHGYYKALVSSVAKCFEEADFQKLGRVRLFLHEDRQYSQRAIAMVRKTGMKVFTKTKHARVPVRFVGVFIADGDGINELLRSMEPPTHDQWDPKRIDDDRERRYAQQVRDELYEWMNENIAKLAPSSDSDELEVEGVGDFLVDEEAIPQNPSDLGTSSDRVKAGPVEILELTSRATHSRVYEGVSDDEGEVVRDESQHPRGILNNRKPKRPRPQQSRHQQSPVVLRDKRIFCADPESGQYVVRFTPDVDGLAMMSVFIQGEDDDHPAPIAEAIDETTNERYPIVVGHKNTVGPIRLRSNERVKIRLTLEEPLRVALEVIVRAS